MSSRCVDEIILVLEGIEALDDEDDVAFEGFAVSGTTGEMGDSNARRTISFVAMYLPVMPSCVGSPIGLMLAAQPLSDSRASKLYTNGVAEGMCTSRTDVTVMVSVCT